jgi:hypothetical protein
VTFFVLEINMAKKVKRKKGAQPHLLAKPEISAPPPLPLPTTVVEMAKAAMAGADNYYALKDALEEAGLQQYSEHFKDGQACDGEEKCPLLEELATQGNFTKPNLKKVKIAATWHWHKDDLEEEDVAFALRTCLKLHLEGFKSVVAQLHGSGDSGGIDNVTYIDVDGEDYENNDLPEDPIKDDVDTLAEDTTARTVGWSWVNNEGGHGTVTINPSTCTGDVTLTYYNYEYNGNTEGSEDGEDEDGTVERVDGEVAEFTVDYRNWLEEYSPEEDPNAPVSPRT